MGDDERAPQLGDRPMGVTTQEYWSTVVAVFVIGGLVGWALLGKPSALASVLKTGTVTDWITALGTWLIGFGAFWYAREAHLLRAREIRSQNEERNRQELLRVVEILAKSTRMTFVIDRLREASKIYSGLSFSQFDTVLSFSEASLSDFKWTDAEKICMSPELFNLCLLLDFDADDIVQRIKLLRRAARGGLRIHEAADGIHERLTQMHDIALKAADLAAARRDQLKEQFGIK